MDHSQSPGRFTHSSILLSISRVPNKKTKALVLVKRDYNTRQWNSSSGCIWLSLSLSLQNTYKCSVLVRSFRGQWFYCLDFLLLWLFLQFKLSVRRGTPFICLYFIAANYILSWLYSSCLKGSLENNTVQISVQMVLDSRWHYPAEALIMTWNKKVVGTDFWFADVATMDTWRMALVFQVQFRITGGT